jgi:hypothetical protein
VAWSAALSGNPSLSYAELHKTLKAAHPKAQFSLVGKSAGAFATQKVFSP